MPDGSHRLRAVRRRNRQTSTRSEDIHHEHRLRLPSLPALCLFDGWFDARAEPVDNHHQPLDRPRIGTQLIACTPADDASDALMTGDGPGAAVSAPDGVIGRGLDADPLLVELLAIGVERVNCLDADHDPTQADQVPLPQLVSSGR